MKKEECRVQKPRPRAVAGGRCLLLFIILHSAFCLRTWGQYSIDWFTVDGGGGTTSDGTYEVSGTIGQPDAGSIVVGNYVVEGGFWSDVEAVEEPDAPWLTIERVFPSSVRVSWPAPCASFVLQECLGMSYGHWANVSCAPQAVNGRNQVLVGPLAGKRFYRLAQSDAPPLTVVRTETNTVVVCWPAPSSGWVLQQCTNLVTFEWVDVNVAPQVVGGTNQVVLPVSGDVPWYRLAELPRLTIERAGANSVKVSWPAPSTGYVLQERATVHSGQWAIVSVTPQVVDGRNQVVITPLAGQRFYRLIKLEAPRLRIARAGANALMVAWPDPSTGFVLQQNNDLNTANWVNVGTTPVVVNGEKQVPISPAVGNGFYRLKYQP